MKKKCPKCKGRMFAEKYYDFVRTFDAWKCCACGEVIGVPNNVYGWGEIDALAAVELALNWKP